jgi:hypothetical protein
VQLIPFAEFAKALTAGCGVDAASYSGGRAITGESLDKKLTDGTFGQTDVHPVVKVLREMYETHGLIDAVLKEQVKSMEDVIKFTKDQGYDDSVAAALINFISARKPIGGCSNG